MDLRVVVLQLTAVWMYTDGQTVFPDSYYCKFTKEHTLCRHKRPAAACDLVYERGVPREDQKIIMKMMNKFRSQVTLGKVKKGNRPLPQAADMMELQWDDELAAIAQRHVEQCHFDHECIDCRLVDRFLVGQNLYADFQFEMKSDWPVTIKAWTESEVDIFDLKHIDKYEFVEEVGHLTQQLWAETTSVGCGFISFRFRKYWIERFYACNYGPSGNFLEYPIYLKGKPTSLCPKRTMESWRYPGLCMKL